MFYVELMCNEVEEKKRVVIDFFVRVNIKMKVCMFYGSGIMNVFNFNV